MTLKDYIGIFPGYAFLVCGCGESLNQIGTIPEHLITIGVNDVGRKFVPDYCLVVNGMHEFKNGRLEHVGKATSGLFTQMPDKVPQHHNVVTFRLGKQNGTNLDCPETMDYTSNSPYMAVILAAKMGAKKIGILGVDFTPRSFFGANTMNWEKRTEKINQEYSALNTSLSEKGIEAYNLSEVSRLTAFPKMSLWEFYHG